MTSEITTHLTPGGYHQYGDPFGPFRIVRDDNKPDKLTIHELCGDDWPSMPRSHFSNPVPLDKAVEVAHRRAWCRRNGIHDATGHEISSLPSEYQPFQTQPGGPSSDSPPDEVDTTSDISVTPPCQPSSTIHRQHCAGRASESRRTATSGSYGVVQEAKDRWLVVYPLCSRLCQPVSRHSSANQAFDLADLYNSDSSAAPSSRPGPPLRVAEDREAPQVIPASYRHCTPAHRHRFEWTHSNSIRRLSTNRGSM